MIDIEYAMQWWIRWRDRIEELEIKRACGVKSSGIEYEIMRKGGVAPPKDKSDVVIPFELIMNTDLAWRRVHQWFPQEMEAIKVFHMRKSFRAVRVQLGVSAHMSRKLVREGEMLLKGGLAAIAGFQSGGDC